MRETNRFYDEDASIGLYGQEAMEEVFVRTLNMSPEAARAKASERMRLLGKGGKTPGAQPPPGGDAP